MKSQPSLRGRNCRGNPCWGSPSQRFVCLSVPMNTGVRRISNGLSARRGPGTVGKAETARPRAWHRQPAVSPRTSSASNVKHDHLSLGIQKKDCPEGAELLVAEDRRTLTHDATSLVPGTELGRVGDHRRQKAPSSPRFRGVTKDGRLGSVGASSTVRWWGIGLL